MKLSAVVAAVSSIVFLAACGTPEGSSLLDTGSGSSTGDIMASSPADPTGSSTGDSGSTTADPTVGPTDAAATTPVPGNGKEPPTGTSFVDPEGKYTMTINPKWKPAQALSKGAEAWVAGPAEGTVPTSVSVLTEDFTGAAIGITLKQYMQISVKGTTKLGFKTLRSTTIAGFNSAQLGVLEYGGAPNGQPYRHFLAIVDVSRTGAAVATLITGQRTFTKNRALAVPYMLTLKKN